MEITILIILLVLSILLYQGKKIKIDLYEQSVDISGISGLSINYKDIYQVDIISEMPEIGMKTYGFYFMSVYKGYFIVEDIGNAYLNLNLKCPPFIRIVLENGSCVFLNLSNEKDTKELFDNLIHMTLK